MRRCVGLSLLVGLCAGCQLPAAHRAAPAAEGCATPETCATAPPPRIEVQTPETIVVKAPTPKVVVEHQQAPCPTPSREFGGAPQNQGPNFGSAPQGQTPSGAMPMGYGAMPQAGYGMSPLALAGAMLGAEIRERSSIGLMFDTIRIPIPWLRLRAIPRPAEITMRGEAVGPGFGAVPMMPMGYGMAPMGFGGVPMGFGGMPMGFGGAPMMPGGGFGAAGGGQMVYTGTQYVPVQGTMPVQVPTGGGVAGVAGGGGAAGGGGVGPGFGGAPGATESAADQVEKLKQKLKECEELQKKIKSLQTPAKEEKE